MSHQTIWRKMGGETQIISLPRSSYDIRLRRQMKMTNDSALLLEGRDVLQIHKGRPTGVGSKREISGIGHHIPNVI